MTLLKVSCERQCSQLVVDDNARVRATLRFIGCLFKFNIPFAFERPKNFLWNTPEFMTFASRNSTHKRNAQRGPGPMRF